MTKSIATEKLTVERLYEVLDYDPETGEFIWKVRQKASRGWNPKYVGKLAGTVDKHDSLVYLRISIDSVDYKAHRLAWLYSYGAWPQNQIDHRDGDGLNNRLENLRDVADALNMVNKVVYRNSPSGVSGVTWRSDRGKWLAGVHKGGKLHWIGLFTDLADAETAVIAKRAELGFSPTHGLTRERRAELGPEAVAT